MDISPIPEGPPETVRFLPAGSADMINLPDKSVDLVFGSPPYPLKGQRYDGLSKSFKIHEWISLMLSTTAKACRVSRGYVLWVVNDPVRYSAHLPVVAGLQWEVFNRYKGAIVNERPVIWHKNAAPNRKNWFSNDWESVIAFRAASSEPYFDPAPVASPPKYTSGGHFRQRDSRGNRKKGGDYPQRPLAHPRDVVRVTVGGGHMGHPLACENEAPFPLKLAEHFILTCCPKGGTVLDPFCGSGTTGHAAILHGRDAILGDLRQSQIDLAAKRIKDVFSQLETKEAA